MVYGDIYAPQWRKKSGARAIAEAAAEVKGAFLLVPCRDASATAWGALGEAYSCVANRLPELTQASHYVDCFISPDDLSWTLLYGHEVDVFGGPIFARNDWRVAPTVERLQKLKYRRLTIV